MSKSNSEAMKNFISLAEDLIIEFSATLSRFEDESNPRLTQELRIEFESKRKTINSNDGNFASPQAAQQKLILLLEYMENYNSIQGEAGNNQSGLLRASQKELTICMKILEHCFFNSYSSKTLESILNQLVLHIDASQTEIKKNKEVLIDLTVSKHEIQSEVDNFFKNLQESNE